MRAVRWLRGPELDVLCVAYGPSDREVASCCVYRYPPRPWVPAARLPGPGAACAGAQGAVRAWCRGWSGERDAMVRRPECRTRYLSEIALLGSVVLPRIRRRRGLLKPPLPAASLTSHLKPGVSRARSACAMNSKVFLPA